ncbi:DUF1295-domain-containing protein [Amniculicola lignicola CBS 123094]|uniref:DUF1295-domain-containing protein n=1 Tax=Amniculicola lignicola CBS 123094 TaxID=1392246 RepID=A0A6A5W3V3_9PLEO|nr:DUF1295-domain-containing protein [Amniculicola lignicola CBS 123094]
MLVPTLATALPTLKTLPDCADFSKAVLPFIPQLYALPQQIFENINDLDALKTLYLATNPLITVLAASLVIAAAVLVVSEINRNYSQVDRLWSIVPVIFNCHYTLWAHLSGLPTQRLDHLMAVTILWGVRLTFNYWRKGGYTIGSEDYRWAIVSKYVGRAGMTVLNIFFISLAQSLLLFLITTPTYILLLSARLTGNTLTTYDSLFPKLIFALVLVEFFADQQQWAFHAAKSLYHSTAKPPREYTYTRQQLDRGFNTSGLWAFSRHPNFAAEQAVWVCFYQWSCCESMTYTNFAFAGALAYLFLFQASTALTEAITKGKYPEYRVYQQRVGKFLPKFQTRSMDGGVGGKKEEGGKAKEEKREGKGGGKAKKR